MLDPILNDEQRELLTTERELLDEVTVGLERSETGAEDLIGKIIQDPALLKTLAAQPAPKSDSADEAEE